MGTHRLGCRSLRVFGSIAFALLPAVATAQTTITWTAAGDGTTWTDPLNWSPAQAPGALDTVVFSISSPPPTIGMPPVLGTLDVQNAFNPGGIPITLTANLVLNGDLLLGSGANTSLQLNTYTLEVQGNATIGRNVDETLGGTLRFSKTGAASLTLAGGAVINTKLEVGFGASNTTVSLTNADTLAVNALVVDTGSTLDAGVFGAIVDVNGAFTLNGTYQEGMGDTQVSGNVTVGPTALWMNNPTGRLVFDGVAAQSWDGGLVNVGNVQVTNTFGVGLSMSGAQVTSLNVSAGIFNLNGMPLTIVDPAAVSATPLQITGTYMGTGVTTFNLNYGAGDVLIPVLGATYQELNLNGSETYRLAGNLSVTGNLLIDAATTLNTSDGFTEHSLTVGATTTLNGTLTAGAGGPTTLSFAGSIDLNGTLSLGPNPVDATVSADLDATGGTLTAMQGTFLFNGASQTLTLDGSETFFSVTADTTMTTLTTAGPGLLDVNGALTVLNGTLDLSGNAADVEGAVTIGDGVGASATAILRIGAAGMTAAGDFSVNLVDGDYDPTSGTLAFYGTGTWSGSGDDFGNVVIDTTGTVNAGSNLRTADLSIASPGGTLDLVSNSLDVNGNLTVGGTLSFGNATATLAGNFNGGAGTTIWGSSGSLILDGSGQTITLDTNTSVFSSVTVNQSLPTDVVDVVSLGTTFSAMTVAVNTGILDISGNSIFSGGAATTIGADGTIRNDSLSDQVHQFLGDSAGNCLILNDGG
ncbi:MAG: hypothetical protein HYY16_02130, partial [Planctomycetes bacterium]|nr:hypothetical protein [Planctomycetota bacterium]